MQTCNFKLPVQTSQKTYQNVVPEPPREPRWKDPPPARLVLSRGLRGCCGLLFCCVFLCGLFGFTLSPGETEVEEQKGNGGQKQGRKG